MPGSIIVAPFSNSDIRDWPAPHYTSLIGSLVEKIDDATSIRVVGTRTQTTRACNIVRMFDPQRVSNDCGRFSWLDLLSRLRAASCVIGNNSGIAHLAASFRVPTVCIFGGSHQRTDWRPLGTTVVVLSRAIACSPCGLDFGDGCPYGKACLQQIEPESVTRAVLAAMRRFGDQHANARATSLG